MTAAQPTWWEPEDFQRDLAIATKVFREQRLTEPAEQYRKAFETQADLVDDLLKRTDNLSEFLSDEPGAISELLADPKTRAVLRYLAGPPISEDDLKTLADVPSLAPARVREDDAVAQELFRVIEASLDIKRFPWMREQRTPEEKERYAAVVASASLLATQRVQTARRNTGKDNQEATVRKYLKGIGLKKITPRPMPTMHQIPKAGEFCGECQLGTRKADMVVGLYDNRVMPIECKVSNSALNSVKRLNNDAAAKAAQWRDDFGRQVVPSAVISGVFNEGNLKDAQKAGLWIFWAHNLSPLGAFINETKPHAQ